MRIALLLVFIFISSSCMQTENSNSLDADTFGSGGSAEFVAAKMVISQSCGKCHDFHTKTEAELKADGYYTSGDPENSKIYFRIKGSTGGQGPKNMPTDGAVSAGDRNLIKTWIQNAP